MESTPSAENRTSASDKQGGENQQASGNVKTNKEEVRVGPLNAKKRRNDNETKSSKVAKRDEDVQEEEWDDTLHKMFVASIYEIGLKNSSPAVILENMAQKPKTITSERVMSQLQKYRNNREKSKQEFMD